MTVSPTCLHVSVTRQLQTVHNRHVPVEDCQVILRAGAGRMAEQEISLESIVQRRPRTALPGIGAGGQAGAPTAVVMITHKTTEAAIRRALDAIEQDGNVDQKPQMIRIEKL